jgi:hypothetical protein
MARDTLAGAHAELFDQLHAGENMSTIGGVAVIYPHPLARGLMIKPIAVTVTTAGTTPDDWLCSVKVYAWVGGELVDGAIDPTTTAENSDLLNEVVMAIEAELDGHWGPSNWTIGAHPDLEETLLAEWIVTCGREDGQ